MIHTSTAISAVALVLSILALRYAQRGYYRAIKQGSQIELLKMYDTWRHEPK